MAIATDWELMPDDGTPAAASNDHVERTIARCRRLVTRRALMAAGVAAVPVPGIDWVTDVGVLVKLIPEINQAFGLSPAQVERLAPDRQLVVFKAISAGGGMLVGKLITRDLIIAVLRKVGVRLTVKQATKYVPLAGQAASAVLTFSALKYVAEQHIQQCAAVSRQLLLAAPR